MLINELFVLLAKGSDNDERIWELSGDLFRCNEEILFLQDLIKYRDKNNVVKSSK